MDFRTELIGEAAKEMLRSVNPQPCLEHFGTVKGRHAQRFMKASGSDVFAPMDSDFLSVGPEIDRMIRSGMVQVIIPMHEHGENGVPGPVLDYLQEVGMPRDRILVVNHFSQSRATVRVRDRGIPMVSAMDVIRCLEQGVADTACLSKLRRGKGIAMLAGLLAFRQMRDTKEDAARVRWIIWHDSELIQVQKYDGLRHLLFPIVTRPNSYNHVMMAQVGRNNETTHAARVALQSLAAFHPDPKTARYISRVGPELERIIWMLCGERAVSTDIAFHLPLATSYTIETLWGVAIQAMNLGNGHKTAQVINPNDRLDRPSGGHAEQFMMTMITRALNAFMMVGVPPHQWTLDLMGSMNARFRGMHVIPAFPANHGPVTCRQVGADRVLPSVSMLIREKWIKTHQLAEVVGRI